MSVFGWSYPPGVTGNEPGINGYDGPCDVCGHSVDDCICPECPECGEYGNPSCYENHGLVRTTEQIEGRSRMDAIIDSEPPDVDYDPDEEQLHYE
jgi:hypothetical protein